jgi:murein L,D-transpeptidase YcbB/YkuD
MKASTINNAITKRIAVFLLILGAALTYVRAKGLTNTGADTSVTAEITRQFNDKSLNDELYFPLSAKRFYIKRGFAPVWTLEQKDQNKTWAAMLLIDCVLQFGLRHEDYHPKDLSYPLLHKILEQPEKISNKQKARFEILLTDAMLNFMNNLHFGKLNPYYAPAKIDREAVNGFNGADVLTNAIGQAAFMDAIVKVQPDNEDYKVFQHQLHMIKGVYEGDCYETPEADVRKIAVNMERLRWAEINDSTYIQINIPSYSLKLVRPDTTFNFKVIVGRPATPTPLMIGTLTDFATSGGPKVVKDWARDKFNPGILSFKQAAGHEKKGAYIYFMPGNKTGIELQGVSDKSLFRKQERATSDGAIRIERAEELAKLLLKTGGSESDAKAVHRALMNREVKVFALKKPVPLRITYITAAIVDGQLVKYNDIYNLDSRVENLLYNLKPVAKTK